MAETNILPAAEFQALPLEYIIAAPLLGVIKAQAAAASATQAYINSMLDDNGRPKTIDLELSSVSGAGEKRSKINAPLLSMVPVPHIRIDSFTTHFKYEISEAAKISSEKSIDVGVDANLTKNPIFNISLKGSVAGKSSEESVMNRSGMLEITVHASEAPIPEGLARLLSALSKALPE